ncbi:MAG: multifunctional CCA addition/repair protein [Proteobacteria bacterium]|nr:multifunctional CCA addition/repair protein [Pseudomonadota bacterium]
MRIYQVGGAVRDRLLGREVSDRDWVVVGASAEQLLALGYRQVGADFPVFLHPGTHEEYALARTERKSGHGYKGFITDATPTVTLEDDLARRDFTINAMAMGEDGVLVDPYGGQRDLAAGVLRHVTAAFVEDPLRVLRAARFAARFGFTIADDTQALMQELSAAGELATLAPERVWQELRRALGEPHPERFIEVLRACGALRELLPEVDALFGVPQPERYHPEIDTGVHLLMTLQQAVRREADEVVRFAVLTHDLGKGTTPAEILPSHHGHEERSAELTEALCTRLRVPREHRELAVLVARLHTRVHRAQELRASTTVRLLAEADALRRPARFEQLLEACLIDATGRLGLEQQPYPQAARLRAALEVVMTVSPQPLLAKGLKGPALAAALEQARIEALTDSGI